MSTEQHSKALCPLCGKNNQCAMVSGDENTPCWCVDVEIDPKALAAIQESDQHQRCLCPDCAKAVKEQCYEG